MEAKKTKNLRVRLRRVKPSSTSSTSTSTASELKSCTSPSGKKAVQSGSSSDSDSDDFATVHFKLAAALEAAAAHAPGLKFDWQSMKNALMCGVTASSTSDKSNEASGTTSVSRSGEPADIDKMKSEADQSMAVTSKDRTIFVPFKPTAAAGYESSSGTSISSDEDDDVSNILLPLFSKPLAAAMQFSKLTAFAGIVGGGPAEGTTSVMDDANSLSALAKILDRMPFNPFNPFDADLVQVQFVFKSIVSLTQLSLRENNEIEVEIKKSSIVEYSKSKKDRALSPFMDVSNIHVKHSSDEFFTFCSCKKCLEYREIVFHIMMEQFKAAHMVVMLLDVLIKAYGPMLKNVTAYNKFEKLLDANKEIYWITCGFIYSKKAEHLDFIYDESLSDNMILVLFSSILMANNPILLLQILAFHVECIVKAYAEGFMEIVEPDKSQPNKTPAEEMLTYILDGYDDLCRISEHISSYLYAFENDFLQRISLTWILLCQRLYQQHVFMNLTDTMLGCIITLKEDELTSRHATLIKKYIQFDDKMSYVERCWTKAWIELNKVNLSERERKRRKCLLDVYHIFDTVVQDAIAFSLQESGDDNDFYDFQSLEDRRLAWQNIMAYTKMKWPDGFFQQPNMLVCDEKCKKCYASLEYHQENCKCITCSIAGGPLPPKRNSDSTCYKCLAHSLVDKEMNLYESKILNVCASDDFLSFVKKNRKRKATMLEELDEEMSATLSLDEKCSEESEEVEGSYHISWAVYKHFSNRRRYRHTTLEERFFCQDCTSPACLLARKILNNEISRELSVLLIHYYQPLSMTREELRSTLPNIMLYNRKMIGSNVVRPVTDRHDFIVKNYWTFIISLYATYFLELDEKCPLNLSYFDVTHYDIGFRIDYKTLSIGIQGNKEDTNFLDFLDKIKSLSPYKNELVSEIDFTVDVHTEEFQNKLGNFMNLYEKHRSTPTNEKTQRLASSGASGETMSGESNAKRNCKEKTKKCCFDHPDLGDHCKENHTGKKRMKKECNHARMNETRDRLRKKLSQLVNARKNINIAGAGAATELPDSPTESNVKQPPSLKSAATAAAANKNVNVKDKEEDDSLECLNTLCKRISHLHNCKSNANGDATVSQQLENKFSVAEVDAVSTPAAKDPTSSNNNLTKDSKTVSSGPTPASSNNNIAPTHGKRNSSGANVATDAVSASKGKEESSWDVASEIYEFIDNYSKDQSKVKKWINETLSYIEGSTGICGNGKKQPQPTNPKKAAKKAKQKQRKEEEKRIAELQDLRAQFNDIYFKEFADKLELKTLKASKKRDKRKIADLEANVKKLQRAKGKVEAAILELIATVKQANMEFRFSYLPTKEQQVAKMKELETNVMTSSCIVETAQLQSPRHTPTITAAEAVAAAVNNLNVPPPGNYTLPYAHANHFPYHTHHHADFPSTPAAIAGTTAYGMIRPPLPTPMCYAPTQHQQLSPEVVAAMAANAACNSSVDPSKRIVTIRRVNLPNVPEPQVTVTAKGSSPDKDKLLYTFVNGQLVQTSSTIPPPMTQLPAPMQRGANASPEQLIAIPLPPLTKTQLKKQRRRLAKFAAEEAQAAAERQLLEESVAAQQWLRAKEIAARSAKIQKEATGNNNSNNKNPKKKAAFENPKDVKSPKAIETTDAPASDAAAGKLKKKKLQQQQQKNSASVASISTTAIAAAELSISKKAAANPRRSASTTTSCSVGTSSATATPANSEVNTRDNSACSQKPAVAAAAQLSKKYKSLQSAKAQQKPQHVQKPQQQQQKKQEARALTPKLRLPSPTNTTHAVEANLPLVVPKRNRARRSQLPDNGQFDNNPFKSLHMQDSDSGSDWGSTCSCGEEGLAQNVQGKVQKQPEKLEGTQKRQEVKQTKTPTAKQIPPKNEPLDLLSKRNVLREAPKRAAKPPMEDPLRSNRPRSEAQPAQRGLVGARSKQGQQQEPPRERSAKSQAKTDKQLKEPLSVGKSRRDGRNSATSNRRRDGGRGQHPIGGLGGGAASALNTQPQSRTSNGRHIHRQAPSDPVQGSAEGKPLSKRAQKQAQRSKKFQGHHQQQQLDCCGGIPNHMGYFNPNEVAMPNPPTPHAKQYKQQLPPPQQQQQQHYSSLTQQMQGLRIGQGQGEAFSAPSYASVSNKYAASLANKPLSANVSIMDQLNRGVQVENLSLPPGITLTKVDPVKSEQLRQKSESIKKLSKPLQAQAAVSQTAFHQSGPTIIAPQVASMSNFYGAPYAGVAAGALDQHHQHQQGSSIIMVEANPPSTASKSGQSRLNVAAAAAAASASHGSKTSKSKKRRNKAKSDGASGGGGSRNGHNVTASNCRVMPVDASSQPEMITLRNPMFHSGPIGTAATILQQPSRTSGARPLGGLPLPSTLPIDQPAAIIKNDNGMFTIRNPALHQAVTNGLAVGGYRQFGNVNYYTPQEAAAEAARATQLQQHGEVSSSSAGASSSFSYFSSAADDAAAQVGAISSTSGGSNNTHKTISISCTSIDDVGGGGGGGLSGNAAVITRPTPQPKCISAIGSEIKSAQQQKQKCKESQQGWTNFGSDLAATMSPLNTVGADNLICGTDTAATFLGVGGSGAGNGSGVVGVGLTNAALQEKYQQSTYYNGFNVFPAKSNSSQISSTGGRSSNTGSLFDGTDCHMHHSCGDDSPPPSITGYTGSYLEGIPNTGVIRYDDASFLKNLIPGQNLNNEVSIHNVNDSNFARNTTSPVPHRVEITPVYTNRPTSANMYEQRSTPGMTHRLLPEHQQQVYAANATGSYRDNLTDFGNDANCFVSNNLLHLNDLGESGQHESERLAAFNYDFESSTEKQKLMLHLNDLLLKKNPAVNVHSQRTSPYLDENALEDFVQNMNTLQISTPADELNGAAGGGGGNCSGNGGGDGRASSISGTTNGWW